MKLCYFFSLTDAWLLNPETIRPFLSLILCFEWIHAFGDWIFLMFDDGMLKLNEEFFGLNNLTSPFDFSHFTPFGSRWFGHLSLYRSFLSLGSVSSSGSGSTIFVNCCEGELIHCSLSKSSGMITSSSLSYSYPALHSLRDIFLISFSNKLASRKLKWAPEIGQKYLFRISSSDSES